MPLTAISPSLQLLSVETLTVSILRASSRDCCSPSVLQCTAHLRRHILTKRAAGWRTVTEKTRSPFRTTNSRVRPSCFTLTRALSPGSHDRCATDHTKAYFAVYGFGTSSFTLVASFQGQINLNDGQPINGYVHRSATNYYKLTVPNMDKHHDITLTATPTEGYPQLFVSAQQNCSRCHQPEHDDPSTWTW